MLNIKKRTRKKQDDKECGYSDLREGKIRASPF
jgi:hypothetical protein